MGHTVLLQKMCHLPTDHEHDIEKWESCRIKNASADLLNGELRNKSSKSSLKWLKRKVLTKLFFNPVGFLSSKQITITSEVFNCIFLENCSNLSGSDVSLTAKSSPEMASE